MTVIPNSEPQQRDPNIEAVRLLRIFGLDAAAPEPWTDRDLAAILTHQLSTPLARELGPKCVDEIHHSVQIGGVEGSKLITFRDLFRHPEPSVKLLRLAKDFFKAQAGQLPQRRSEQQVAYLLYLLTLIIARIRAAVSITKLADADLIRGAEWAMGLQWVDDRTRSLLIQGLELLRSKNGSAG